MAQNFEQVLKNRSHALAVTVLALVCAAFSQSALAADAETGRYTWSAELVSFDEQAGQATLKTHIDTRANKEDLAELSEGERITITWTGMNWGAGIAHVTPGAAADAPGPLTLPAEFVRTELDRNYLVYTVAVPEDAAARIQGLEAGDWVTGVSPKNQPGRDLSGAVIELRPYNEVS